MKQPSGLYATASKIRREVSKGLSRLIHVAPASTCFEGLEIKVPLLQGLGADHLSRPERPWTYPFLRQLLRDRPGALVDIGANVGLYLIWLRSIDPSRDYLGFEPNPACYFYLQELVRCNGFTNCSVFPIALSDERGPRNFYARRLGDKMGSLLVDHRFERDKPFSFNVMTEPGDPVLASLNPAAISAMKIDVEGCEAEVLQGLAHTLTRYRPTIICEVLSPNPDRPDHLARTEKLAKLLSVLGDFEYTLLSRGGDGTLSAVITADDLQPGSHPDRILVPSSEVDTTLDRWVRTRA